MRVGKLPDFPLPPDYNIAPTTHQPIVRLERDTGDRELVLARWGLVPFFAKDLARFKGFSTINARAETVQTAATWREPFKKRRCLVPVDGFYEWKTLGTPGPKGKPAKQPYSITVAGKQPFAFAGLWDAWKDKDGGWLQSFAIITTDANEAMSAVHTRMPVILPERDWVRWLAREYDAPPPVDLLRPYDSDAMRLEPCNAAVGNVRNNGPEMLTCPVAGDTPVNSA